MSRFYRPLATVVALLLAVALLSVAGSTPGLAVSDPTPAVFIATGDNFPDALGAGPAAAMLPGPLLLVRKDSIPSATANELVRLEPAKIYVVGGTGVISEAVVTALGAYTSGAVIRLSGADRYATAAAISNEVFPANLLQGPKGDKGDKGDQGDPGNDAAIGGSWKSCEICLIGAQDDYWLNVPPAQFVPEKPGTDWDFTSTLVYGTGTSDNTYLMAPVLLPDGKRIMALRAYILDESNGEVTVTLRRRPLTATTATTMAAVTSDHGDGTIREFIDTTVTDDIVDNSAFSYELLLHFDRDAPWPISHWSGNLALSMAQLQFDDNTDVIIFLP